MKKILPFVVFLIIVAPQFIGCNGRQSMELTGVKVVACGESSIDTLSSDEGLRTFKWQGESPACDSWGEKDKFWDIKLVKIPKDEDWHDQQYEFVSASTM